MTEEPRATPKPWPLFGYAPGNYHCKCFTCEKVFEGDKRASRCLECAASTANAAWNRRATPAVRDGLVERTPLKHALRAYAAASIGTPCPICDGKEGCDHTVRERLVADLVKHRQRPEPHAFNAHPKYPWFCQECGYPEHTALQHGAAE